MDPDATDAEIYDKILTQAATYKGPLDATAGLKDCEQAPGEKVLVYARRLQQHFRLATNQGLDESRPFEAYGIGVNLFLNGLREDIRLSTTKEFSARKVLNPTWRQAVDLAVNFERYEVESASISGPRPDVNKIGLFPAIEVSAVGQRAPPGSNYKGNNYDPNFHQKRWNQQPQEAPRRPAERSPADQPNTRPYLTSQRPPFSAKPNHGPMGPASGQSDQPEQRGNGGTTSKPSAPASSQFRSGHQGSGNPRTQRLFGQRHFCRGHFVTLKQVYTKIKELFDRNSVPEKDRIYIAALDAALDEPTEDAYVSAIEAHPEHLQVMALDLVYASQWQQHQNGPLAELPPDASEEQQ
jgi:hypothetical protein